VAAPHTCASTCIALPPASTARILQCWCCCGIPGTPSHTLTPACFISRPTMHTRRTSLCTPRDSPCAEYVLEFQKCLDRTDPVPYSVIRGIIQQELRGRSIESVFSYINPEPLASASVAQVCGLQHICCTAIQGALLFC
jgi:hypothetical protein